MQLYTIKQVEIQVSENKETQVHQNYTTSKQPIKHHSRNHKPTSTKKNETTETYLLLQSVLAIWPASPQLSHSVFTFILHIRLNLPHRAKEIPD